MVQNPLFQVSSCDLDPGPPRRQSSCPRWKLPISLPTEFFRWAYHTPRWACLTTKLAVHSQQERWSHVGILLNVPPRAEMKGEKPIRERKHARYCSLVPWLSWSFCPCWSHAPLCCVGQFPVSLLSYHDVSIATFYSTWSHWSWKEDRDLLVQNSQFLGEKSETRVLKRLPKMTP